MKLQQEASLPLHPTYISKLCEWVIAMSVYPPILTAIIQTVLSGEFFFFSVTQMALEGTVDPGKLYITLRKMVNVTNDMANLYSCRSSRSIRWTRKGRFLAPIMDIAFISTQL